MSSRLISMSEKLTRSWDTASADLLVKVDCAWDLLQQGMQPSLPLMTERFVRMLIIEFIIKLIVSFFTLFVNVLELVHLTCFSRCLIHFGLMNLPQQKLAWFVMLPVVRGTGIRSDRNAD